MKALVIGAAGFVGAAICRKFLARGYEVTGLARNSESRAKLVAAGVVPHLGDMADLEDLKRLAGGFDIVVMSVHHARELELAVISAIIESCRQAGGDKHFIFTSGTGVLAIDSPEGRWNEISYSDDEEAPFPRAEFRTWRMLAEDFVRRSAGDGLNTYVIRPPLIYGHGGSNQVPAIFHSVLKTGAACYLGHGLNLYSNVHVDDLAEAYGLIVDHGTAGAVYHTVAGEANFRAIAEAVASVAGCEVRSVDFDEACSIWGTRWTRNALAVNSRSTAPRARRELGWVPTHIDLIEDIRRGSYADAWSRGIFGADSRWPG